MRSVAPGSLEVNHIESGRKNNQDYFLAPPFWGEAYIRSPFFAPIFLFAQTEVRFREERDSIYDTCANGVLGSVKMRFWASCRQPLPWDYFRIARQNARPNPLFCSTQLTRGAPPKKH